MEDALTVNNAPILIVVALARAVPKIKPPTRQIVDNIRYPSIRCVPCEAANP
jgi:hypothetical protein